MDVKKNLFPPMSTGLAAAATAAPSPDTPPPARLLDLPTGLLVRAFSRCDPIDIARAAAVSLVFHASLAEEGIRLRLQEASYEPPAQPEGESCAVHRLLAQKARAATWLAGDGRVDATCVHRGVSGCTLLLVAASNGHKQLVEVLLKRGAKLAAQNSYGVTALMLAANQGREQVVELLLQHGAEVDLQDGDGDAALTSAAIEGHPAVVLQLLRAGADMALRTADGKTAMQIAKEKGHTECVAAVKTFLGEVAVHYQTISLITYLIISTYLITLLLSNN